MAPRKTREKRVFGYRGVDGDELAAPKTRAPKKAERKRIARVGAAVADLPPTASRDGLSINERRIRDAMGGGGEKTRSQGPVPRPEGPAMRRLKQVARASELMEPHAYQRALGMALRTGLKEQRAEGVEVAKRTPGRQTEKNREHRKAKRARERAKQERVLEERREEKRLKGTPEVVPFGEVIQEPPAPPLAAWVAKLEKIKQKSKLQELQQQGTN